MHPSLEVAVGALETALAAKRIGMRRLETDRSPGRQAALYAQGRTAPGKIVTHAKAYESSHNWGLAIDVTPVPDTPKNWKVLRAEAARLGFGLLGEWDPGHLQHPAWPSVLAALRRKYPGAFA